MVGRIANIYEFSEPFQAQILDLNEVKIEFKALLNLPDHVTGM